MLDSEGFSAEDIHSMFSLEDIEALKRHDQMQTRFTDDIHPVRTPLSKRQKCHSNRIPEIPDALPLRFTTSEINPKAMQLFGDNESLINQLNLLQALDSQAPRVVAVLHLLGGLWQRGLFSLRTS